jgi:hypothetical protein
MGTGVWNGNGEHPAQLDAWCRYYLGWENAITITDDTQNVPVDYFLNQSPYAQRLYKVPISENEYYLIENRQQNPDHSIDPYFGLPSYTFALIDSTEQDYFPAYPLIPMFNFMENRYKGNEWDYFLPGLGGPDSYGTKDGSGLLIWHIDEYVIQENFDPGFVNNHVNANAAHKGVDLEEADGIQNLDTDASSFYKYGGPYDSFRSNPGNADGNNTYFGKPTISIPNPATPDTTDYVTITHLPAAESYYGGFPLEIYDISESTNLMTFSVRFGWKLATGYSGQNKLDASSIDFDHDGAKEICYPMPDGQVYIWKNEEIVATQNMNGTIGKDYVWDGDALYFPVDYISNSEPIADVVQVAKWNNDGYSPLLTSTFHKWATPLVSAGDKLLLGVINTETEVSSVLRVDKESGDIEQRYNFADSLQANLAWYLQKIYAITKPTTGDFYKLNVLTPGDTIIVSYNLPVSTDSTIVAMSIAKIIPGTQGEIVLQTPYSVYLTGLTGHNTNGYPKVLPFYCNSPVTISDVDKNGNFDMLLSGENTFAALDYLGDNILTNFAGLATNDSLHVTSGVLAGDFDSDGKIEFMGAFSRNRLVMWDDDLRLMSGFPISFSDRSRNLPFIQTASDSVVYAWVPTDNGKIFRTPLPEMALNAVDEHWFAKYGNLERTASREDTSPIIHESSSLFVPSEVYVFPNPLKSIYEQKLTFQIMTSKDAKVEVSVYDISAHKIFQTKIQCSAWLRNREQVDFPVEHLSSGVYIAVFKSGNDVKRIKFAVEK